MKATVTIDDIQAMPGWDDATSPLPSDDEMTPDEAEPLSPQILAEEFKDAKSEATIESFSDLYDCLRDALLG